MQEEGYLSSNATSNPQFYNWTKVYLPYCDGSSQTSDIAEPQPVNNGTV